MGTFVTLIGITLAPTALRDLAGERETQALAPSKISSWVWQCLYLYCWWTSMEKASGKVCHCFLVLPQERLQDVFTYGGYCFHCAGRDIPAGSAFAYGVPEFKLWPIFLMTIFCIINMIQCIGVFSVMDEIADVETENEIKERGSAGRQ